MFKSPGRRFWLGLKSVGDVPVLFKRGWRNAKSNSPWCFEGRSESGETVNLRNRNFRRFPSHGFNKDRRKSEPVDRRLCEAPGYNKDHRDSWEPNPVEIWMEKSTRNSNLWKLIVAVYLHHVDLTVLSIFQKAVTFDHNFYY